MPTLLNHPFYLPYKAVFSGKFQRSYLCTFSLIKPFFTIMIIVILCVLTSNSHDCMGQKVSYVLLPSMFGLSSTFETFLSLRQLRITSLHVFLGFSPDKPPPILNVLHLQNQLLSSIVSRCSSHCSILFCNYSQIYLALVYS